jgi:D-sedoheptulose 7-phosphate isomerase
MQKKDRTTLTTNYINNLKSILDSDAINGIQKLVQYLEGTYTKKKNVFIIGNGGSSSTASHMTCDLQKGILGSDAHIKEYSGVRVSCLTDNVPLMSAWANDYGYDYVFSRQLFSLGRKGDLLIVISASGNSKNILEAISQAKKMGIKTFGLLGFTGGTAKEVVDDYIYIKSNSYGIVEDAHMIIGHIVTELLKDSKKIHAKSK